MGKKQPKNPSVLRHLCPAQPVLRAPPLTMGLIKNNVAAAECIPACQASSSFWLQVPLEVAGGWRRFGDKNLLQTSDCCSFSTGSDIRPLTSPRLLFEAVLNKLQRLLVMLRENQHQQQISSSLSGTEHQSHLDPLSSSLLRLALNSSKSSACLNESRQCDWLISCL